MKKKKLTEANALRTLGKIAEETLVSPATTEPTGSCVYTTSSGATYCAVLTEAYCTQMGGTWTEGGSCP